MKVVQVEIWWMRRQQYPAYHSLTTNPCKGSIDLCAVCASLFLCWKKHMCCHIQTVFKKWCQTVCNIWCEVVVSKEMDPIIVMTLITHSTPTLISCNGTSWITWDFLETSTSYSENSHLCWDKPSFVTKQSELVSWLGFIRSVTWQ